MIKNYIRYQSVRDLTVCILRIKLGIKKYKWSHNNACVRLVINTRSCFVILRITVLYIPGAVQPSLIENNIALRDGSTAPGLFINNWLYSMQYKYICDFYYYIREWCSTKQTVPYFDHFFMIEVFWWGRLLQCHSAVLSARQKCKRQISSVFKIFNT